MAFVYSCCFWFSLRLGGILIGFFSVFQAVITLIVCFIAQSRQQELQDQVTDWLNNMKLIYTREYLENIRADPEKQITLVICLTCLYIFCCVLFIYGAYKCNNVLMIGYILAELFRLIVISFLVATWLLLLKQNSMDIGLLIGASVAGGFFLMGMFYLWVCAANLPILINEIERDEHEATLAKLNQLMTANTNTYNNLDNVPVATDITRRGAFMITRNKNSYDKPFMNVRMSTSQYYR